MQNKRRTIFDRAFLVVGTAWVLGLALAACKESDVPVVPASDDVISFGARQQDELHATRADLPTTRADQPLHEVYDNFKVWGYKTMGGTDLGSGVISYDDRQTVMNGYYVEWKDGSGNSTLSNTVGWEYVGFGLNNISQDIKFWDMSATSYRFFGFAPNDKNVQVTVRTSDCIHCIQGTDASYAELPLPISVSNPRLYSQMWFSDNVSNPKFRSCVQLSFKALLSRVRFVFRYPEGITPNMVAIRNLQFLPADGTSLIPTGVQGGVKVHYPLTGTQKQEHVVWPAALGQYDNIAAFTCPYEQAPLVHADEAEKWYYVLPVAEIGSPLGNAEFALEAVINGKNVRAIVPAQYMQWKANYAYTYYFKITDTSIAFDTMLEVYTNWQAGYSEKTQW